MRIPRLFFIALILIPAVAGAQPLADRVPADAVFYVGWRGSETSASGYETSHLKAVIDACNAQQIFTDMLPKLVTRLGQENKQAAEAAQLVTAIGGPLWRHPSAIYFGGVDLSDPKHPMPRLAIICDAGADAPKLLEQINQVLARAGEGPIPLKAAMDDKTVILSTIDLAKKPAQSLTTNKAFTESMAALQKDPVVALYIDGAGLTKMIGEIVDAGGNQEIAQRWPAIRDAIGLNGLRGIACAEGFEGQEWSTQLFVNAPAPRAGLLSLIDSKPISNDLLKVVPKSATFVFAGSLDVSNVIAQLKAAAVKVDAQAGDLFDKGMAAASAFVGANVQTDVLDPLGSQWAVYCAPDVGGNGFLGATIVNKLDDPAKAQRGLGAVEVMINNMIVTQFREKNSPKIAFRTFKNEGTTIHYLAVPFISPAWAIKDGNLYIGFFPQVVVTASNHFATSQPSIVENESFAALRARLGGEEANGIQFVDLPRLAPNGYADIVGLSRLAMGLGDVFGVPAPAMIIPPLDKLLPHLAPAGGVSKVDAAGYHYRGVTPFPGAGIFGMQGQGMIGQQAMMMSVLLPSLSRARETANRVKCASNERQIGQALMMYANDHKGKYPPDLGTLVTTGLVTPQVFVCPLAGGTPPGGAKDQQGAWVNDNSSYVYLAADKSVKDFGPEDVLVHENFDNHNHEGLNLLYGDGHVSWENVDQAEREIEKVKSKSPNGKL